jgi:hypothetical protein
MSNLTDALETISKWLEQNKPELFASLQPGLSINEIEAKVQVLLPARLPVEMYDLYQWRNGTNRESNPIIIQVDGLICECHEGSFYISFGSGRAFQAFSALYFRPLDFIGVFRHKRATLLEVFSHHNASFVTCSNEQQVTSPLLGSDTEYCYSEVYPSATNLFLELAEALSSGVIFIDKGILSIDTQKEKALSQKYGKHWGEEVDMGDYENESGCSYLIHLSNRL